MDADDFSCRREIGLLPTQILQTTIVVSNRDSLTAGLLIKNLFIQFPSLFNPYSLVRTRVS
jgi:hypothetical protein